MSKRRSYVYLAKRRKCTAESIQMDRRKIIITVAIKFDKIKAKVRIRKRGRKVIYILT